MTNWSNLHRFLHTPPYNKNMNKTNSLKTYHGGRVLANESAMRDPAVVAMFAAMEERNWEDLKHPSGHFGYWNISDRH